MLKCQNSREFSLILLKKEIESARIYIKSDDIVKFTYKND
jgi:hypothetical protein